jgi:glycosyltransferase involved in cell wall biosynthesis
MKPQEDAHNFRPRLSVVIPALNEAQNLPYVLTQLPADTYEIIVVDGHSADATVAVAKNLRPDVRVVVQTRRGKGNALACGLAAASGDIIATIDADGSADPAEIPRFVTALLAGADFAKGSRFKKDGGSCDITRLRRLGNRALRTLVNLCYGTRYSDLCYGFNVFWRQIVPVFRLDVTTARESVEGCSQIWGDGFEIETLINIRIARAGLIVTEVPSYEHARIHGVSNLNAFRDGMRVLRTILSENPVIPRRAARRRSSRPPALPAPRAHDIAHPALRGGGQLASRAQVTIPIGRRSATHRDPGGKPSAIQAGRLRHRLHY